MVIFKYFECFGKLDLIRVNLKGGCCRNCGSVEHYYRDCPEVQKQSKNRDILEESPPLCVNLFNLLILFICVFMFMA